MATVQSRRSDVDRTCRFRRIDGAGFRLALEVTRRCNLACRHCFVQPDHQHPATGELVALIQEAGRLGCRKLIVTGGEPLLRPDLEQIVATASECGALVDLNSNLYSLTRERVETLRASGLQEASASLYGGQEQHDELTGTKGSFDRALAGIDALRQAGVTVDVHGAIWDRMLPHLESLVETAARHGVSSITFFSLLPTASWSDMDGYTLSPGRALEVVERARASAPIPIRTIGLRPLQEGECAMADGIYGLDADLKLSPCLLSHSERGGVDLRAHSFREGRALLETQIGRGDWRPACCPPAARRDGD